MVNTVRDNSTTPSSITSSKKLSIAQLIRPHWKALTIALLAVLGVAVTDIIEPWPLKIIVDNLLQSRKLEGWLAQLVLRIFGQDKLAILNFAVAGVAFIAVLGAVSDYVETYMTNSVSQWVAHDLRRTLYNHIQ